MRQTIFTSPASVTYENAMVEYEALSGGRRAEN
jgi:hypothetical protein